MMNTIIYNDIIPAKGFKSIALLPFIFVRNGARFSDDDERHERIHLRQQLEVLIVAAVCDIMLIILLGISWWWMFASLLAYYAWYGLEWLVKFVLYRDTHSAYRNISFEQEAYNNEGDHSYLYEREPFAWVKYLTRKTYKR